MSDSVSRLPLASYRVVDFGHYIAGPVVSLILADLGADVVSITPIGGPRWDHPVATILNRNKTVCEIDLKTPEGLKAACALSAGADVVIENFRPGVMDRLGLGVATLRGINPELIYLSLPGFASTDTERHDIRAFEAIVSSASGQFTDMGLNRVLMGINPSYSPLPLASAYGATLGANAVLLALYSRERTGMGDQIEVPLASALMEGLVYNSQRVENYPERYKSPREKEIEKRTAEGLPMNLAFDELQEFLDPFYRSYMCADGRMFYVVSASHTDHAKRTLKVLGVWDEIKAAGIPQVDDWYRSVKDWPSDCALGAYPLSRYWADIVAKTMAQAFLDKTAFEWEELFGLGRVPGRAHRTTQEWLTSDHALKSGLIVRREDPQFGELCAPGPLCWLTDCAEQSLCQTPPVSKEAAEILGSWPVANPKMQASRETTDKNWLSGIKVLDMTNVIAGPTMASLMSRFGAEVVKLDPIKSTFDPWNTIVFGMQAGRGKKSLLTDIKTPEGEKIFHDLLRWADIVTINAVDRQIKELGLDEASLAKINPCAILCQVDAFGGPAHGPMSDHLGYDDTVQAATGVMIRFGGGRDTPEEHAHFGTIDVLGGFSTVMACVAALIRREKTGKPGCARSSLMAAGQLIQLPFMYDHPNREPFDEPSGREVLGEGAHYRFYEANDGWFFLACADHSELNRLESLTMFKGLHNAKDKVIFLQNVFAKTTVVSCLRLLKQLDIAAIRPASMAELREVYLQSEGQSLSGETYQFTRHNIKGANRWVDLFAPCAIRPMQGNIIPSPPAEKYGASSRNILLMLGYPEQQIDGLLDAKIVSESWSDDYLPE